MMVTLYLDLEWPIDVKKSSIRHEVLQNAECLLMLELREKEERSIIKGDLHISYEQPLGLGRTQGWRLWANINGVSAGS